MLVYFDQSRNIFESFAWGFQQTSNTVLYFHIAIQSTSENRIFVQSTRGHRDAFHNESDNHIRGGAQVEQPEHREHRSAGRPGSTGSTGRTGSTGALVAPRAPGALRSTGSTGSTRSTRSTGGTGITESSGSTGSTEGTLK